jgi:fructose-1,6-bisphosphatase I
MAKSGAAEDDFIDFGASFVVVADPLDGSRNADINIPVGSIFGIYQFKNNEKLEDVVLKPGRELIAAGYAHYGKATSFVCVPGPNANACEFCLDEKTKEFKLVKDKITIPKRGQVYSLNDAREPDWPSGLKKYIDDVRRGDGESGKKYSARYICALTADFHRTIQEGGWCGNPRSHLRVVYECNPLAFVAKACGGRASDGERDILDILPADFHEKTPLFAGSSEDIAEIEKYENVKQTEGGGYKI